MILEVVLGEGAVADWDLDSWIECARVNSVSVAQKLRVDGQLYVLVAVRGPDAHIGNSANNQQAGMHLILDRCKPEPQSKYL